MHTQREEFSYAQYTPSAHECKSTLHTRLGIESVNHNHSGISEVDVQCSLYLSTLNSYGQFRHTLGAKAVG